jgi:phage terminase large subunit
MASKDAIDLGYLSPKQEEFYRSTARYTCYGGARGGGKTHAIRIKAIVGAAADWPGIRILIIRRTYPELQSNHIEPLLKLVPTALATYNVQQKQMYFINGSIIKFGHFQSYQSAMTEYQGQEYDWIFFDEATQFTEEEFRYMGGCLRGANEIPKQFFLTCNPGGVGHRWVKRLFIDRDFKQDSQNPEENENPDDYYFIQAKVDDNVALMNSKDGEAYKRMLSSLPESIRAAHRDGDWDVLSGSYFPEFSPGKHVVAPFKIPAHWTRYRAFDYGLDMLAVVWAAVDERGRAVIYREYRQSNLNVSEAAQAIIANTGIDERIAVTFAPPDMWNRQKDSGKSMAELFMVNGVPIIKADNNRVQGWLQVKEFLMDGPDGQPGLVLFNNCKGLISDLETIQTDETNPNDCAKQPHDITHGPDSLRYFCVSRTLPGELPAAEAYRDEFDEEDIEDEMTGGEISAGYINA